MSGREWLVPITPGELEHLRSMVPSVLPKQELRWTLLAPTRLVVQGEQHRWALEELARMRGVDVRSLTL